MATPHIDRLLETCVRIGASDILLHAGQAPLLRVDGRLRALEAAALTADDMTVLAKAITPAERQKEVDARGFVQFAFDFGDKGRFRACVFRERATLTLTLRYFPRRLLTFEEIGLPTVVKALCRRPHGLFLVTGATGSGKSSTLAAVLDYINRNFDRHILTIEDSVEFRHIGQKSCVSQCEAGTDVTPRSGALQAAWLAGPDVVFAGDLSGLPAAELSLRLAEAGRLVFGTLDITGAGAVIDRLVFGLPGSPEYARRRLSSHLLGILSQTLIPRARGAGRLAAFEFLINTPSIAALIAEGDLRTLDDAMRADAKYGMQLLDDQLLQLARNSVIMPDAALEHARDPGTLQTKLGQADRGDAGDEPLGDPSPARPDRPPPGLSEHAGPSED